MRRPSLALTAALSWIGVVAGHLTAYVLAYPSAVTRDLHLEGTGHGWVGAAAASLAAAIPVIVLAAVVRSVRSDLDWTPREVFARILAVQLPVLVLIEVAERGWSLEAALSDPAVLVAVVLQPLLALLSGWGLHLLHRAVRALVAQRARPLAPARRAFPRPAAEGLRFRPWLLVRARRRAPPELVSA